jgi:D-aminopeptidase
VKEAVSHTAARCLPVEQAHGAIEEAARDAVQHASEFKPFRFEGPVTAQVVFTGPGFADTIEQLDFVTRVDGRTVMIEASSYLQAFERFNALHFLAPVVR